MKKDIEIYAHICQYATTKGGIIERLSFQC